MSDDDPSSVDDLRPGYDASVLKGGVRGKYLERYRSETNPVLQTPDLRKSLRTDERPPAPTRES